jgi:predicted membrane-bound spermidine synthase
MKKNSLMLGLMILFAMFLFSGFSGLIYESIWTHYLKLFIGHAAYAQTLVLCIYMGGMALGSWIASLLTHRLKNLLVLYAVIELIVGLVSLFFHSIFINYSDYSFTSVIPSLNSSFSITLYKWVTASLLILPQTVLLGATFPLMSGGIVRIFKDNPGKNISILYFLNSLGAALGVLFSGFFLIDKLGLPGTIKTAAYINIIIGIVVLLLAYLLKSNKRTESKLTEKKIVSQSRSKMVPVLFTVALFTALASFVYEIGWIRMLSLVLGSSTHAFELMLASFILGLAIGGLWIKNKIDTFKNPLKALAVIQLIMGLLAISTLLTYDSMFHLMKFALSALQKSAQGYVLFNFFSGFICIVVMLPATICAGMTLPLITSYLYKETSDESYIGKVYALNTMGSILGVIIAIQLLMPLTGLKGLIIIGGFIDMLVGALLIWQLRSSLKPVFQYLFYAVILLSTGFSVVFIKLDPNMLASGVYRFGMYDKARDVVYYKDGKTSSVALFEYPNQWSLANNGKVDASLSRDTVKIGGDELTQAFLGLYPLAYKKNVSTVGIVGLGSGMTGSIMLEDPRIDTMDIVEIEPYILNAARMMGPKVEKVFTDKRCAIHIDDAKTYFSNNKKKYDIIVSEPSNPWVSGVSGLFSKEFFKLIKRYLHDDGILVQWFHVYEINPELIASIIKALGENFNDYAMYSVENDLIILASDQKIPLSPVHNIFATPRLNHILNMIGMKYISDMKASYVGNKLNLGALVNSYSAPANSDFYPYLDLNAVKARYMETNANEYLSLNDGLIPIRKILENDTTSDTLFPIRENPVKVNRMPMLATVYKAHQIVYYLTTLGTPEQVNAERVISPGAALLVSRVRMASEDGSIGAQRQWSSYVLDLLKATMPHVSSSQMSIVWKYIDRNAQQVQIPPDNIKFFNLLKMITRGEFAIAKTLSASLLDKPVIKDTKENRILLVSLLISCYKTEDYQLAEAIWKKVKWDNPPDFTLRILSGIILNKLGIQITVKSGK